MDYYLATETFAEMSHMACVNEKMNNRKYFKELSSVMSPFEDGYINMEKKFRRNYD